MKMFEKIEVEFKRVFTLKLSEISKKDDFNHEDIVDTLNSFYDEDKGKFVNIMGSIINSILTTESMFFVISKSVLNNLVKKDKNHKWKGIQTNEYKIVMAKLYSTDFIEPIYKPTGRKPGLYKVKHPDLIDMLKQRHTDNFFNEQKEAVLELYDRFYTKNPMLGVSKADQKFIKENNLDIDRINYYKENKESISPEELALKIRLSEKRQMRQRVKGDR